MDEQRRSPTTFEQWQANFQRLERGDYFMCPTKMNLGMMLQAYAMLLPAAFVAAPLFQSISQGLVHWGAWRYVMATVVAGGGGLVAGFVGFCAIMWIYRLPTRRYTRKVKKASDEELREIVNRESWSFKSTIALLQLAARGQDVSGALPRIAQLLESVDYADRDRGSEALHWIFFDEDRATGGQNPYPSYGDCRFKAMRLRGSLDQDHPEASR
jgi:hypothetical protein